STFQYYTHLHHAGVLQQCGSYFEIGENHIGGGAASEQRSSPPVWETGSGPGWRGPGYPRRTVTLIIRHEDTTGRGHAAHIRDPRTRRRHSDLFSRLDQ